MGLYLSPDGKAARMTVSDRGDPATPEGIARVAAIKNAAEESLKSTPLETRKSMSVASRRPTKTCTTALDTTS